MRTDRATTLTPTDGLLPRLALRPREAAQALGISKRLPWTLTNQGDVPHLRLGRTVVYPVDALRKWLDQRVKELQK